MVKRIFFIVKKFVENNKKDIFLFLLAFLIIALSFGLGYLAGRDINETPIIINKYSK